MNQIDKILHDALNAAGNTAEALHGKEVGDQYRRFADKVYPKNAPHVHDYRKMKPNERTDKLIFVCSRYRCDGCGDEYNM